MIKLKYLLNEAYLSWTKNPTPFEGIRMELISTQGHRLKTYKNQEGVWELQMQDGASLGDSSEFGNLTPSDAVRWANTHL
jgi:hypothetical protein